MRVRIALQSTSCESVAAPIEFTRSNEQRNGIHAQAVHRSPVAAGRCRVAGRHANNRKVWLAVRDLFPHPYTIKDAQQFLQRATTEQPEMKFCVEIEGAAVGGIGVHPGQDVHRFAATMGYWLGEQFWGRGIMTEAVTAVTDFCFDNFPLRRISAEVFSNNPASARVLEKAGFNLEGRLKNHVMKEGKLLDSLIYARTK